MKTALAVFLFVCSLHVAAQEPMGTQFTYQGNLHHLGTQATGVFDFQFSLFDEAENGVLVAGPVENADIQVQEGVFTTELDFGAEVFAGTRLWLEIGVREGESTEPYTTLKPRQALTATPYAITALKVAPGGISFEALAPTCSVGEQMVMGEEGWECCGAHIPELCDGLDNNCDGIVDEGFLFDTDINNCGSCGNVCQEFEGCLEGECRSYICIGDEECDDGNFCTIDACESLLGCNHTITTGAVCSDGNACTVADVCDTFGQCVGSLKTCDDALVCTTDACDQPTGACNSTLQQNWCLIEGVCYTPETVNPSNAEESCQPGINPSGWTPVPQ